MLRAPDDGAGSAIDAGAGGAVPISTIVGTGDGAAAGKTDALGTASALGRVVGVTGAGEARPAPFGDLPDIVSSLETQVSVLSSEFDDFKKSDPRSATTDPQIDKRLDALERGVKRLSDVLGPFFGSQFTAWDDAHPVPKS